MQRLGLFAGLLFAAGCGGFLGLEDYQRDILSVLITQVGEESASDGLSCWDLSSDGMCDPVEDWNGPDGVPDDVCDAWDCQGADGADGLAGVDGQTGQDGVDGRDGQDGMDGMDGVDGTTGVDGVDGIDGADGEQGPAGTDGVDGSDGDDGEDGSDGEAGDGGVCTTLCHNGQTKVVAAPAVEAHLAHGDTCGACE